MRSRKKKKHKQKEQADPELYLDMDGDFAFIAGFTSGGAPYGVRWEEAGIDPDLPFGLKVRLYREQPVGDGKRLTGDEEEELPFD